MDYNKLVELEKEVTDFESAINKAEGQATLLKEQLKEQGFSSLKKAQQGIEELNEKKEEYKKQYDSLLIEIEKGLEGIEEDVE